MPKQSFKPHDVPWRPRPIRARAPCSPSPSLASAFSARTSWRLCRVSMARLCADRRVPRVHLSTSPICFFGAVRLWLFHLTGQPGLSGARDDRLQHRDPDSQRCHYLPHRMALPEDLPDRWLFSSCLPASISCLRLSRSRPTTRDRSLTHHLRQLLCSALLHAPLRPSTGFGRLAPAFSAASARRVISPSSLQCSRGSDHNPSERPGVRGMGIPKRSYPPRCSARVFGLRISSGSRTGVRNSSSTHC